MMYVYDSNGDLIAGKAIDFSSIHASNANFNPATDSLADVAQAINNTFAGQITATVVNGQLSLAAASGNTFRFGSDSAGLYAALGLNTLLTGSKISDVAINSVMLILTRRPGESLHLGDHIKITVLGVQGKQIKIGLEVPDDMQVYREEVYLRVLEQNRQALCAEQSDVLAAARLWPTKTKE